MRESDAFTSQNAARNGAEDTGLGCSRARCSRKRNGTVIAARHAMDAKPMETKVPLVVWSRVEDDTKVARLYAWRLDGYGWPFEDAASPEQGPWDFVCVMPRGFPLSLRKKSTIADCAFYDYGSRGETNETRWVLIRTEDVTTVE
jgi:hypothetical protein